MPTAAFTTLGCKVNQYETQRILDSFEESGFTIVPFDESADVYVINTCSVTSIAESKSRYSIRRATRNNALGKVVVTGCAAQMSINKDEELVGADLVVPNPDKLQTLEYFFRAFPEYRDRVAQARSEERGQKPQHRTRATLKVQDGCSVFCSYCSIPYTRPVMISRPWTEVVAEAKKLAANGFHEAILTGVLIGSYGPETGSCGPDLPELIERVAIESGLARIRISSIEMQQVSPRLVNLLKQGLVVPHLHIPLQSGDSEVLRDMSRPYDQAQYLDLCRWLTREIPDLSITTDIMVGFPTETEERFESSVHVCREVGFLKAHVFSFSPRFGTPADAWGDTVSPQEKQRRRMALSEVCAGTAREFAQKFIGRTLRVLVEGKCGRDGLLEGLTDNYLSVKFPGPSEAVRSLQWVRVDEMRNDVIFGEIVKEPTGNGRLNLRIG